VEGQFSHFIEQKGSSLGRPDDSYGVGGSARKCALDMPVELRLEERFAYTGAVDGDEGTRRAMRTLVDPSGKKFFARSRFALQQYDGVILGYSIDDGQDVLKERTDPDQWVICTDIAKRRAVRRRRGFSSSGVHHYELISLSLASLHAI